MSLTLDSVTTSDAVPAAAPYRISAKPGKSIATVKFTPTGAVPSSPVRAWRLTIDSGRLGRAVAKAGAVCGMERCGDGCGPLARLGQVTALIPYPRTQPAADGDHTIEINAMTEQDGWL